MSITGVMQENNRFIDPDEGFYDGATADDVLIHPLNMVQPTALAGLLEIL